MENTISKRIPVNASTAEPSGKPLSGDKTLRIEPSIRFYELLDGDKTEEVEEAEILITHNKSLAASNQNLVKRKFPYIEMFDHEVPAVVSAIRYLTSEVFEHLDITSPMEVYQRIAYTQRILIGVALKKYKSVMKECKELEKDLVGDKFNLSDLKELYIERFWT